MVTWKQIDGELDGYRVGFVAVFRKYEGQPTDKHDAQGRPMKVSAHTFAAHIKVDTHTFRRWIKNAETGAPLSGRGAGAPTGQARTGQVGRQIAKSPSVSVTDKVGMLQDLVSDKRVMKQFREQRAPVVTAADAKAAEAVASAVTAPIVSAAGALAIPMWLSQLKAITRGISELELGDADYSALRKAAQKLMDELDVQAFRLDLA